MLQYQPRPRSNYDDLQRAIVASTASIEDDELWRAIEASMKAVTEEEQNLALALERSQVTDKELALHHVARGVGPLGSALSTCQALASSVPSGSAPERNQREDGTGSMQEFSPGDEVIMRATSHADIGVPIGSRGRVLGSNPDGSQYVSFPQGEGFYLKEELLKAEPIDLGTGISDARLIREVRDVRKSNAQSLDDNSELALLLRASALAAEAKATSLANAISASLAPHAEKNNLLPAALLGSASQPVPTINIESDASGDGELQLAASAAQHLAPIPETNMSSSQPLSYVHISTPPSSPRPLAEYEYCHEKHVEVHVDDWDDDWTIVTAEPQACSME